MPIFTVYNRKNWLGSEVGRVVKTVTVSSLSGTTASENGRTILRSGTLITDATLGKGLLVNDADVTDGAVVKSVMIRGTYIPANLPVALTDEQKAELAANGLFDIATWADLTLKITVAPADADLLGKTTANLQSNIKFDGTSIYGTLKYVTGYTGFSGDASEQSGNYIALKATAATNAVITGQVIGGDHGAATLDDDGILICRIKNNTQRIKFVATIGGKAQTVEYDLINLTLTPSGS